MRPGAESCFAPGLQSTMETRKHEPSAADAAGILDHQRTAYERLLAVANACFFTQRTTLPLRPRTNTLLVGPSGSGKTFLAGAVAKNLGVPFLSLTVGEWILLGCTQRGAQTTWPLIVAFLQKHTQKDGVVLFLDEIDKICGDTSWERFLRTEVFKLLDLGIPEGLCDGDDDALSDSDLNRAREVLANRTFIIGAGAFQGIWENRSKTPIGFSGQSSQCAAVSLADLSAMLPRELTNRFRAEVLALPKLTADDYRRMISQTAAQVPIYLRETFLRLANERVASAIECQQGCRFLEEIMLDAIIHERQHIKNWKNPAESPAFVDHAPAQGPAP